MSTAVAAAAGAADRIVFHTGEGAGGEEVAPPARRRWSVRRPSTDALLAVVLLATTVFVTVAGLAGVVGTAVGRTGAVVASEAEARLVAGVVGNRTGWSGADPLALPDSLAARQLAVLESAAGLGELPAVDAARIACLLLAAVTALLLLPVLRALDVGRVASAVAVVAAGVTGVLLVVDVGATAASPAAFWAALAGALGAGAVASPARRVAAGLAAAVAVLTAPLLGAPLLAVAAHLVHDRTLRVPGRLRLLTTGLLAAAAVLVVVVTVTVPAGSSAASTALLLVGALVVVLAAVTQRWSAPLLTGPALLLVLAALPVPAAGAAAVLAGPGIAVVAGVLLGAARPRQAVAAAGCAGALAVALVVILLPATPPAGRGLAAWVVAELPPGTPVYADALDRAELLAAGVEADRLRDPADPAAAQEARLLTTRPGVEVPACPAEQVLAVTARGSGGASATLCAPAPTPAPDTRGRARLGEALVDNPGLRLGPGVADLLRTGGVDERVTTVLAAMATARAITVEDIPTVPPDAPQQPRRRLLITEVDGDAAADNTLLGDWLAAQQPPYAPARVEQVGSALLLTWYAVPVSP